MTSKIRLLATTLVVVVVSAAQIAAQGLVTDRPDFTESAITVPAGVVQLEGGLTLAESSTGSIDATEFTVGELLVRWGLADRIEIRFEAPNYISVSQDEETLDGFDDVAAGFKYQIGPVGASAPIDVALIGMVSLPTGDNLFGSDEVEPEAILTFGRDLSDQLSLGAQLFAGLPDGVDGRTFEWGGTVVAAAGLGEVGVFVELAIDVPEEGTAPIVGHGGVAIPFGTQVQLDVHAGFGLSETAPDYFVGAGAAIGI